MADALHHALSSVRKWGGQVEDYLLIHQWFDETKGHFADPRHRAIRHHSQGIAWAIEHFGAGIPITTGYTVDSLAEEVFEHEDDAVFAAARHHRVDVGRVFDLKLVSPVYGKDIPTRWIAEQHVLEDFGRIPTMADFLREMAVKPWMVRGARKLSREL